MSLPRVQNTRELQQAFVSFNQLSQQLINSYQTLEQRVAQLGGNFSHDLLPQPSKRHRAVLNALPAGVIVLDGAGVVQECNPAAIDLLGEPLLGQRWRDIIARAFAPQADDGHDVSLRDGRRVNLATTPLGDEPGQVVSLTDVTRARALQDKLSQFERLSALGEMAAGLAHQLRTPLSAAVLYLGMLKRTELNAADRIPLAEKALGRLRHLETLVRDMLLLVRADHDGGEPLTVADVLRSVDEFARPHVPVPRIRFAMDDTTENIMLRAQRDVLISALQNLISNAIQSIDGEGEVTLRTQTTEAGWVDIQVIDTGCGM
ncbi:MAG: PAS domain-containing protein, partial [Gammaproteobacteria bacterium]|nr:PAS domain-containing protein [Gammaproteobacteria bacterium]